tara:strand:- start:4749 stop:5249 length:501 start_codon:yes stop_codon:yes gene_type:complete
MATERPGKHPKEWHAAPSKPDAPQRRSSWYRPNGGDGCTTTEAKQIDTAEVELVGNATSKPMAQGESLQVAPRDGGAENEVRPNEHDRIVELAGHIARFVSHQPSLHHKLCLQEAIMSVCSGARGHRQREAWVMPAIRKYAVTHLGKVKCEWRAGVAAVVHVSRRA